MIFPFSLSGTVTVNAPSPDLGIAIRAVTFAIEEAEPHYVSHDTTSIKFRAGPFRFVWNWNILGPISFGCIDFSSEQQCLVMRYYVSFMETLLVALALGLVLWFLQCQVAAILVCVVVIAGDYLTTWFRFPGLLREAAERAFRLS